LLTLLKIGVTVLGLVLVLRGLDFRALLAVLRTVSPAWMAAGAALIALSLVVRAYRWHVVLRGVGSSIRFGRLVALYLVGSFFNAFLPSGLGGDVVRAAEAAQDVPSEVAAGTVLVDRLTGLMALFAMALAVLPFRPADFPPALAWMIGAICLGGLVVGLALVDGRLLSGVVGVLPGSMRKAGGGFLDRLTLTINSLSRRALVAALLVSLLFNLMQVGWWATTGRALGLNVPFSYYLLIVPIMSLALLVPSVGGLGVRESVAPALFAGAGLAAEQAVALTLLVFGLERLASLLGAPVYIASALRGSRRAREHGQTAHPR
jgi:uncharacterized membrane protein YbhN (UPF0104 family)